MIRIIVLTTFEATEHIIGALESNDDGYIVKDIGYHELILTIRCVHCGLTVLHENVKQIVVDKFKKMKSYKLSDIDGLSEKELEIIKLIARGFSNKDIVATLNYFSVN